MAVSCINRSNPYVLVGVMAAGQLTFVATNLEGLVEVSRGRTGLRAGRDWYRGREDASGGPPGPLRLVLRKLSLQEVGGNAVTVEHDDEESSFKVTLTGEYGGTKRRIVAVFSIAGGWP